MAARLKLPEPQQMRPLHSPECLLTGGAMMADGGHKLIGRTAEAVAFTWEGAAWPSRRGGVAPVRRRVEALSAVGVDVVVLSQADVAHVDEQLRSRPPGPGRLLLCGGRGPGPVAGGAGGGPA